MAYPSATAVRCLVNGITGLAFASISSFWPLLIVAFIGTLNPSSGDVSVFLPLEHARLAQAAKGNTRTTLFARYTLIGSLSAAVGALAAAIPSLLTTWSGLPFIDGLRAMFVLYGLLGGSVWLLYRSYQQPLLYRKATGAVGAVASHRFQACHIVQRRCVCWRAGGQLAADTVAL